MLSNLNAFEEDPIAFQSGLNITSYNRARNLKQKERMENMPWLEGKNLGTDKMGQRLLELMHFTNNKHWEKEKQLGTFEAKKKYPYFIASVKEDAHGLTVILTDLLGIKLFQMCGGGGTIGIDGTGRGADLKGRIMQYSITGDVNNMFSRNDKTKSGIYTFADFFMIGKGTTNTANIESALDTFKQEVIKVTKDWKPPKYVKLDGETALINACKRLGPETRRIVERNHALRRLEYNFLKGPLKDLGEDQAVFFKLWDRFCDSRSFLDADVMRKEIRKTFQEHPGYETMMKHLQIYFDDPQIICYYGRSDMPEDILLKHQGPAEVDGFFDKLKNDYTSSQSEYLKNVDKIIYDYKHVKDALKARFLNDFQNSKKGKGLQEVVEKYKAQYDIDVIPPSPRKPRPTINRKRKSPRKLTDSITEQPAKTSKVSGVCRNLNNIDEDTEETDMNTPFEQQLNKGAISSFSKSKKKRGVQRRNLINTHKEAVDSAMKDIDQTLDIERRAAKISLDIPSSQFTTIDADETDFSYNLLLSKINKEEICDLNKVILTDSETKPDYSIWETLEKVTSPETLDFIPFNKFFDISPSSPVNSALALILEKLLSESDVTTSISKSSFRYLKDSTNDVTYL